MKRGSNNRKNEVHEVPPVDPIDGDVDIETLEEFRHSLRGMPYEVYALFDNLTVSTPAIRLLRALNTAMRLMLQGDADNAGIDGLQDVERQALTLLHANGMTTEQLGTAHTLLCIPERIAFIRQWRDEVRRVRSQKRSHLTE
jgi:hypothetical protein